MLSNWKTLWQLLRRGSGSYFAYRNLREKLLLLQKDYAVGDYHRRKKLRTFLEETNDALPVSALPGNISRNVGNVISKTSHDNNAIGGNFLCWL